MMSRLADKAVPRVAVLGTGTMAAIHATAARTLGITVIALASRSPSERHTTGAGIGVPVVSIEELPGLAGTVIVATPPFRHVDDAIVMLGRGANVIVETPLASTLTQADRLIAAAGTRVGYAENLVCAPVVTAAHARIGSLGPLSHLEVRALAKRPSWGSYTSAEWGGGVLFSFGVHPLAVAMMMAAPATVASVRCTLTGWRGSGDRHDSDEHAEVELTFTSGLRAAVVATWQESTPLWDLQASSATGVVRAEITPEPVLEFNGERVEVSLSTRHPANLDDLGYTWQLRSMLDDFAAGTTPLSDGSFGRAVLDVTCACYASAGAGSVSVAVPFEGPRDRTPLQLWRGT